MPTLMLATSSGAKIAELHALLALQVALRDVTLLTPRDWPHPLPEVAETGTTFAGNARLKAVALAVATSLPTLADDSGLCVEALGGAPGLYSARWAGEGASDADRNAKLLSVLADVSAEQRSAQFVCALALALPDGRTTIGEGSCEGRILTSERGVHGFGYDPLFFLPLLNRTMAELTDDEKNVYSHRAIALLRLAPTLISLLI